MLRPNRLVTAAALLTLTICLAPALTGSVRAADAPKTKAVDLPLEADAAVVLDADHNGMPAKTKILSTASYASYSLDPLIDGIKKREELGWQQAAWASEEAENAHGIEIQFSKPQHGGRFQVSWAYDANFDSNVHWWPSRDYVIQVKDKAGDDWKTVIEVKNNQSIISSHALPEAPFSFLRIYQPAGGGHANRPNIMWVGQLELTD